MEEKLTKNDTVHKILAHSYSLYLGSLVLGLLLDYYFPYKIFQDSFMQSLGFAFLGFATALVVWAQLTSRNLEIANISKEAFQRGPYRGTRTPTHWGLFLMMLGFGIVSNELFVIVFSFLAFLLTKLIFVKKEEDLLAKKYGEPYLEYKRSVKL